MVPFPGGRPIYTRGFISWSCGWFRCIQDTNHGCYDHNYGDVSTREGMTSEWLYLVLHSMFLEPKGIIIFRQWEVTSLSGDIRSFLQLYESYLRVLQPHWLSVALCLSGRDWFLPQPWRIAYSWYVSHPEWLAEHLTWTHPWSQRNPLNWTWSSHLI